MMNSPSQNGVLVVSDIELNQGYMYASVDAIINETGLPHVGQITGVSLCHGHNGTYITLLVKIDVLTYTMTVPPKTFSLWFDRLDAQSQASILIKGESAVAAIQELGVTQKEGVSEIIAMVKL